MSRIDKSISIKFLPWLIPVGASLFVLFLINTFLFKLIYIPSFDMNPTYQKGDLVLVKKKNTISDNQVIVFNFFSDDSLDRKPILFTQRCIAKPGDTLLIESGFVYVNSISERNTNRFYYNYHFKLASKIDSSFLIKYNLKEGGQISNELDYSYSMKESTADSLRKDSLVISV